MLDRRARRRFALALDNLLRPGRSGFFIPYRHAASARPIAYMSLLPAFEGRREAFAALLNDAATWIERFREFIGPPPLPRVDQDWFPRLDGVMAYTLTRRHRPSRIVEIGSGHSTRFFARAKIDGDLPTTITAIDPQPRAALMALPVEHVAEVFGPDHLSDLETLQPGDFLVVDSSHVAMPGSDVDLLVNAVWPRLRGGVLVHFHDVFLPDPYPAQWAWRGYNEQMLLAALLQGNGAEIVFPSHFVVTRMHETLSRSPLADLPRREGAHEGSLWLRKR